MSVNFSNYGIGSVVTCLPILGPITAGLVGLIADTFVDPFAHVTIREKNYLIFLGMI